MMTSALQRTETERWGRGISLLAPASIWPRFRARLTARLTVRLTGVPEYPSDGLMTRLTMARLRGCVYLGMWPWHDKDALL